MFSFFRSILCVLYIFIRLKRAFRSKLIFIHIIHIGHMYTIHHIVSPQVFYLCFRGREQTNVNNSTHRKKRIQGPNLKRADWKMRNQTNWKMNKQLHGSKNNNNNHDIVMNIVEQKNIFYRRNESCCYCCVAHTFFFCNNKNIVYIIGRSVQTNRPTNLYRTLNKFTIVRVNVIVRVNDPQIVEIIFLRFSNDL